MKNHISLFLKIKLKELDKTSNFLTRDDMYGENGKANWNRFGLCAFESDGHNKHFKNAHTKCPFMLDNIQVMNQKELDKFISLRMIRTCNDIYMCKTREIERSMDIYKSFKKEQKHNYLKKMLINAKNYIIKY